MFTILRWWSRQTDPTGLRRPTHSEAVAQYNTYDARSALSQLLKRVHAGERIVIARAGEPIAVLVPYREPVATRPGIFRMSLLVHDAPEESPAGAANGAAAAADAQSPKLLPLDRRGRFRRHVEDDAIHLGNLVDDP